MAQSALAWNRELFPAGVRVSAAAGWLTLSGEVLWSYQRQDAVECVRHLPGVVGVSNDITLRPSKARLELVEGVDEGVARAVHAGHPLLP